MDVTAVLVSKSGRTCTPAYRNAGAAAKLVFFVLSLSASKALSVDQDLHPPAVQIHGGRHFDAATNSYYWLKHVDGRQVGDAAPFTSLGGSRFRRLENGIVSYQGQGIVTDAGDGGANIGLLRRLRLSGDSILGFGLWYDVNQSHRETVFHQSAPSLELLQDDWGLRCNDATVASISLGSSTGSLTGTTILEDIQINNAGITGIEFD